MKPKERLHALIRGKPVDRVPVTPIFMAWAAHVIGRSYRDYYLDGSVLVSAQLAMARTFGVDQVSAISDPWREAEGFGMAFDYPPEGTGIPKAYILHTRRDIQRLAPVDPVTAPRMKQRVDSVRALARAVGQTHSVLGWVEGPLAEYADLRGVQPAMLDLLDQPDWFETAAEALVATGLAFARAQIDAGADMIGIGDSVASLVGPELYATLVLPWQRKLIAGIHDAGATAKLHICGDIRPIIEHVPATGADVIDLDWMVPLAAARQAVGEYVTLCGNFDPSGVLLQGTPDAVAVAARDCIAVGGSRFILMPGCEVPPATPEANVRAFCPCDGCLIPDALETPLRRNPAARGG